MIGPPNRDGDGHLALLLVDKLFQKLIEDDVVDKIEIAAWVDEIRTNLERGPQTNLTLAAQRSLNGARIGS